MAWDLGFPIVRSRLDVRGEHSGDLPPEPLREGALTIECPHQARACGNRLHGPGEGPDVRPGQQFTLGYGGCEQCLDCPPLALVDGQGMLVELWIREVDAQERQMVGEGFWRRHRGHRLDDERRERGEGRIVPLPRSLGKCIGISRGLLGQRKQQATLGSEALHERAGDQPDRASHDCEREPRGTHPADHLGRRTQDHRIVNPSGTSRCHHFPKLVNACSFIKVLDQPSGKKLDQPSGKKVD